MFNQQQNKPFGNFGGSNFAGGTTPFGASNSSFNKPGGTGFGGGGGFGGQTPASTGLFGSTATSTASGGLFGGSSFGQNQQQNTGFGTTSNFGGAAGNSLFGNTGQQQQQQQSTSLFSTPTTSSVFGAKTPVATNTGFGGTSQSSNVFGAQNTGGSTLFGQSNNPSSLFGASAAAFGGQQNVSGTTIKFNPLNGQDTMLKGGVSTSITTRHQCITAMKEYENKSLEELRYEDYAANRKGPQAGSAGASLLGSTQNPATSFSFNAQKSTGFSGFGGGTTGSSSLFGQTQQQQPQQQPQNTTLFGANNPSKSLFGTTATTTAATTGFTGFGNTSGTSLFGQNQQNKGVFGTATTQATGGLFGNTQTSTGGFGNTAFGFGQTSQQAGGLFGQKTTGFGTTSTAAGIGFGQQNPAGGIFSKTATTNAGFGFGQTSTAGFGTTPNTGLFNKPPGFGAGTSTLGSTGFGAGLSTLGAGGSSLFGGNQNKPGLNLGGGFGTGSGLGTTSTAGLGLGGANTTLTTTTEAAVAAQQAVIQQHMMYLKQCPYGDNPLFRNVDIGAKREEALKPTNPVAQKAVLSSSSSHYKVSSRPMAKIKPKPIQSMLSTKSQLFDGFEEEDSFGNTTFVPRKSIKKLVIKKKNGSTPPGGLPAAYPAEARRDASLVGEDFTAVSPRLNRSGGEAEGAEEVSDVIVGSRDVTAPVDSAVPSPICNLEDSLIMPKFRSKRGPVRESSLAMEDSGAAEAEDLDEQGTPAAPHPAGIVLRRSDYFTMPPMDELASMVAPDGSCVVVDFVIGRTNYGNVFFPGKTDVAGLNLDEIVHFRHKEVTVYPEEDGKPTEGEGLNKLAQVTLERVWPNDKTDHSPIKSPNRLKLMGFEDRLMRATAKMGAKFMDYRPDTGSWVFEVKHFSKYGLQNDSEDEDDEAKDPKRPRVPTAEQLKQLAVQRAKIAQVEGQAQMVPPPMDQDEAGSIAAQPLRSLGGMVSPESVPLRPSGHMGRLGLSEEDSDMADIMDEKLPSDDDIPMATSAPASERLASQLGVSAHNVQLMKASFFGDDEEEGQGEHLSTSLLPPAGSRLSRPLGLGGGSPMGSLSSIPLARRPERPRESAPQSPVIMPSPVASPRKHSFLFERARPPAQQVSWAGEPVSRPTGASVPEHPLIPSGMVMHERPRKLVGSRVQRQVPALEDSMMCRRQHLAMDAALFHGRASRVGWGPGWTLVHSGSPILEVALVTDEKSEKSALYGGMLRPGQRRLDSSPYQVVLEQVLPGTLAEDLAVKNKVEETLSLALQHSESGMEEGCPIFTPCPGVSGLHAFATLAHQQARDAGDGLDADFVRQCRLVLELCCALWGTLPGDPENDPDSYSLHQARREALTRWLMAATRTRGLQEVQKNQSEGNSVAGVWSYLSVGEISAASQLAQESGDHRLALLLAQAAGASQPHHLVAEQLQEWAHHKMDQFMEHERLQVYTLLGGNALWQSSFGLINGCEGLDWKRCLAVHLWYLCPPSTGISEALRLYSSACSDEGGRPPYCVPPFPPYLEDSGEQPDEEKVPRDVCYHLLQLYTDRTYPLHHALAPTSTTAHHLDHRLSWQLWCILQSVGYCHLSHHQVAAVCSSYAAQLDALGLWHWAVFVLLHIPDSCRREQVIRDLLGRHMNLSSDSYSQEREKFLLEKLHIPAAWVHEAKWLRAREERRRSEEAWHLLKAGRMNDSHRVLLRHLAAEAIINERYKYLKIFLHEMKSPEYSAGIQGWSTGGKVYLDYITMMDTLEEIKQGDLGAYELERLQPEVTSLCTRLSHLECHSPEDRLCQSEMAKRTANLMRTLLMLQHRDQPIPTRLLAPHVGKLPLPEDYALQELRHLARGYMLELCI